MSDKTVLEEMFKRAGIVYNQEPSLEEGKEGWTLLEVEDGYPGFFAGFDFDETGALKRVSAWE